MNKSLPRAVIFDWDNTLVDSWEAIAEAINYVRARYGLPTWDMAGIIANCTRSARESFPDWFGDKWQSAWTEYYAYFEQTRARMGLHPVKGAGDVLAWLYENKIPMLVVSNKSGEYLRQEADQLGWHKYFMSIVGAHDASRDKPAREHADHALKLAGLEGGVDIWFVGDSEADIACARNASLTPVLIGNREYAKKLGVDIVVADCAELLELLSETHRAIA
ncbi:MAG: HAD family hydrolase [Alphaproteobacteria bacterium]